MSAVLTSNNLSELDKTRAKQLASWFKEWKRQGRKPMTQSELIKKLKDTVKWEYTRHSFPALINYIRMELNICIASSNEGLYYAETEKEKREFLEYYESLIAERLRVLNWIKKDIAHDQTANQAEMWNPEYNCFGENRKVMDVSKYIEMELKSKLGAKRVG